MATACNHKEVILATECNDGQMRGVPMLHVLVSGFEPFGGMSANPSADVLRLLDRTLPGIALRTVLLPVSFARAGGRLRQAQCDAPTDVVLGLGLAGGRDGLTVERVAINLADARIADNEGARPIDRPVVDGGPAAYFATLPAKAMAAAIRAAGIEASVSQTAGTFVCNHVFYEALHRAGTGVRCGFVHLPWLPGQEDGAPSMDAATVARGVEAVLLCLRDGVREPMVSEGALS